MNRRTIVVMRSKCSLEPSVEMRVSSLRRNRADKRELRLFWCWRLNTPMLDDAEKSTVDAGAMCQKQPKCRNGFEDPE